MHREGETVRQALHAGAAGYVVKGARSSDLLDAIRAVSRGERYLHSSVTGAIVDDSMRWMAVGGDLSSREREVLASIASGNTIGATATTLGISPNTVRRHLANISEKLDLHGAAALTRYANEHGAEAEVIKLKITSMESGNYAMVQVAEALSKAGVKLVPDVVAGGAAAGGTLVDVLLANLVRESVTKGQRVTVTAEAPAA